MKLVLVLLPDGHGILKVPPDLRPDTIGQIRRAWEEWKATPAGLLVFPGEVEHATEVEIDLPIEEPA